MTEFEWIQILALWTLYTMKIGSTMLIPDPNNAEHVKIIRSLYQLVH
jgi:hypothetical protein